MNFTCECISSLVSTRYVMFLCVGIMYVEHHGGGASWGWSIVGGASCFVFCLQT